MYYVLPRVINEFKKKKKKKKKRKSAQDHNTYGGDCAPNGLRHSLMVARCEAVGKTWSVTSVGHTGVMSATLAASVAETLAQTRSSGYS